MIRSRVILSELAFDILWEGEFRDVNTKPLPMHGPSPGSTYGERAEHLRTALAELRESELAEGDDPDPELLDTIRLLGRPHREIYGWLSRTGEDGETVSSGVLVAGSGEYAVLAVLEGGQLTLDPVEADRMTSAITGALPDATPLDEQVLNVPGEEFNGDGTRGAAGATGSRARGHQDAQRLRRLLDEPRSAAGQLYTAHRDGHGTRRRCQYPLNYFDIPRGRFITVRKPSPEAEDWLIALPGSANTIGNQLRELAT